MTEDQYKELTAKLEALAKENEELATKLAALEEGMKPNEEKEEELTEEELAEKEKELSDKIDAALELKLSQITETATTAAAKTLKGMLGKTFSVHAPVDAPPAPKTFDEAVALARKENPNLTPVQAIELAVKRHPDLHAAKYRGQ